MPVEIRELEITTSVQDSSATQSQQASQPINKEAIVAECVEAVLEILKQKNER